jgi:hypothetical protein
MDARPDDRRRQISVKYFLIRKILVYVRNIKVCDF